MLYLFSNAIRNMQMWERNTGRKLSNGFKDLLKVVGMACYQMEEPPRISAAW